MVDFFDLILAMALSMLGGALFGLIPFYVGRYTGKPNLGRLGFKWCIAAGLLFLQVPTAIGFTIAILVRNYDYYPPAPVANRQRAAGASQPGAYAARPSSLGITCLSGPLKGRTYPIGDQGLVIGRDPSCAIRFSAGVAGISRQHCTLRWQNGTLMLTDLSSTYGTFLADGRKLPPQYPTAVSVGSRFYLANGENLFQIVITL